MPYKAIDNWVYVKRDGKWIKLKKHNTPTAAKAHAIALNINVNHKGNKRG